VDPERVLKAVDPERVLKAVDPERVLKGDPVRNLQKNLRRMIKKKRNQASLIFNSLIKQNFINT
jgi:hypothetical protein